MLRKVESTSDINRGPEPCQSGTALVQCGCMHVHVHDDHYRTHSKYNSLFTEMITPQTYIHTITYIYTYKTASCLSCIQGSLRLAPNKIASCLSCIWGLLRLAPNNFPLEPQWHILAWSSGCWSTPLSSGSDKYCQ